jgi:hypothetical protein
MAEKVAHDVNGLHFSVGNPASLAATIHRAATSPGLWERLQAGIPAVRDMDDHVATLAEIYRTLIAQRASATSGAGAPVLAG